MVKVRVTLFTPPLAVPPSSVTVTVMSVGHPPGRGVAYSTRRPEHVLNVVARNMSALADQPDHFLDWLGTRHEYAAVPRNVLKEDFLPRRVYGDYLQSLFLWYSQAFADGKKVRIEWLRAEAVDVGPNGEGVTVPTADGGKRNDDKDVLATIYHLLGVDPHRLIPDRLGRPLPLVAEGSVVRELLT